jgi:hypothetical protein
MQKKLSQCCRTKLTKSLANGKSALGPDNDDGNGDDDMEEDENDPAAGAAAVGATRGASAAAVDALVVTLAAVLGAREEPALPLPPPASISRFRTPARLIDSSTLTALDFVRPEQVRCIITSIPSLFWIQSQSSSVRCRSS